MHLGVLIALHSSMTTIMVLTFICIVKIVFIFLRKICVSLCINSIGNISVFIYYENNHQYRPYSLSIAYLRLKLLYKSDLWSVVHYNLLFYEILISQSQKSVFLLNNEDCFFFRAPALFGNSNRYSITFLFIS